MPKIDGCFCVASLDSKILIKVEGHASMNNSMLFKDFAEEMLKEGYHHFIVDLSLCKNMDSTFMGILVGLLHNDSDSEMAKSSVVLVNTNALHRKLLDSLGLSAILTIKKNPIILPEISMKKLKEEYYRPEKRIQMIRNAHELLIALNEKNRRQFQTFIELLDEEQEL